jgi:hypothetical protein
VVRRYLLDPPLDIPSRPRLAASASFVLFVLWALLTLIGLWLLLTPVGAALGLPLPLLMVEVGLASLAALSSLVEAYWRHWFNEASLEVPKAVKSGEPFVAQVVVVPYAPLRNVHVSIAFIDRFFVRNSKGQSVARQQAVGGETLLSGGSVRGRRREQFAATFIAPLPLNRHSDVTSELTASLLGLLGWVVPGLKHAADNLREHGGYYLRVTVRVGLLRRVYERRVIIYHLGRDLLVG